MAIIIFWLSAIVLGLIKLYELLEHNWKNKEDLKNGNV